MDQKVATEGFATHPPLTLYNPASRSGFKTVVVTRNGSVPEEALAEITAWLRAGCLPDGAPLAAVDIIVPTREAALRIREPARAAGVSRILYTDNSRTLWDPVL